MAKEARPIEEFSQRCSAAYLIGVAEMDDGSDRQNLAKAHLLELRGLMDTLEIGYIDSTIVNLRERRSKYGMGSGRAEEIAVSVKKLKADLVVFDGELPPSQQRNLEKLFGITVIDRHEVILDIFAQRAMTREARLQVESARLRYSLPRLKRAWTHLSRQRGGTRGTRGEGETQIEVDRRLVLKRIHALDRELRLVGRQRQLQRKQRETKPQPSVALIGYTNAGKSSLMNALTDAGTLTENKLFATLDPISRRLTLPGGRTVVLTDTVGFIRRLPHELINAFRSTLEEATSADFFLLLFDAAHADLNEHLTTVRSVLHDLQADTTPALFVFNKTDLLSPQKLDEMQREYPDAIFVSVKTRQGIEELLLRLSRCRINSEDERKTSIQLPLHRGDLLALIHRRGRIVTERYDDNFILIDAYLADHERNILEEFISTSAVTS